MGLYLNNGNIYGDKRNVVGVSDLELNDGATLKVEIDMNKRMLVWYL